MNAPDSLPKILIADESRTARTLLIKHIRGHYTFREEADGESAWQTLVIDQSIQLVVCALSLPILSGNGLLQRVRSSRLPRLSQLPILMISGDDKDDLERAKANGASDFITRQASGVEVLSRIDSLVNLAQTKNRLDETLVQQIKDPETGLFTQTYIETQVSQAITYAQRYNSEVSVIVMGFDNQPALVERHGPGVLRLLQKYFIEILGQRIRKEDSFGHLAGNRLAVVSPGTPILSCGAFVNRMREAIHQATITVNGERLNASVSFGVSNFPTDESSAADRLIALAGKRFEEAQRLGGNRVIAGKELPTSVVSAPSIDRAISVLKAGREKDLVPHAAALSRQLVPLLRWLDGCLKLGLSVAAIEERLREFPEQEVDADAPLG